MQEHFKYSRYQRWQEVLYVVNVNVRKSQVVKMSHIARNASTVREQKLEQKLELKGDGAQLDQVQTQTVSTVDLLSRILISLTVMNVVPLGIRNGLLGLVELKRTERDYVLVVPKERLISRIFVRNAKRKILGVIEHLRELPKNPVKLAGLIIIKTRLRLKKESKKISYLILKGLLGLLQTMPFCRESFKGNHVKYVEA